MADKFSTGFAGYLHLAPVYVSDEQQEFFSPQTIVAAPDLVFVRSSRARNYRLTLRRNGVAGRRFLPAARSGKRSVL
jgi:hypothetical protein